jgi:hypothetical protein
MPDDAGHGAFDRRHGRLRTRLGADETVATGRAEEIEAIKTNFLMKMLGLADDPS